MPSSNYSDRRWRRYDPLAVLAYIATYQQQHRQRSPSERCIQIALGISAPSVVHNILQGLQHDGLLTTTRYGRGQLVDHQLTPAGQAAVAAAQAVQPAVAETAPSVDREIE